jgi:hypothetical protein
MKKTFLRLFLPFEAGSRNPACPDFSFWDLFPWKGMFFVGIGFSIISLFITCEINKSPITPTQPKITLTADYIAVTEAWLKVQLENSPENGIVKIWRDTTIVFNGKFAGTDTTVWDTGLSPAHNYAYKSAIFENGKQLVKSLPLKITTMDTTSHEFSWQIYNIESPFGSGVLRDAAIINPENIWVVGEIYADSAQPWIPYNAVHWNGQQWELKRIKTNACGGVVYPPIETIFAFSANDILYSHIDGSITHFDGNNFTNDCSLITQLNGSANKMWGRARTDLQWIYRPLQRQQLAED